MIVDLPAPFSPTTAWISPGEIPKDTSLTAVMPPKGFVTPSSRMMYVVAADSVMGMLVSGDVPPGLTAGRDTQRCAMGRGSGEPFPGVADRHTAVPRPRDPRSSR